LSGLSRQYPVISCQLSVREDRSVHQYIYADTPTRSSRQLTTDI
jgi:hypothetical protein